MSQSVTILLFLTAFSQYIVSFAQGTLIYEKKAKLNCFISVILCVATIGLSFGLTKVLDGDKLFLSRVYGTFFPYGVVAVVLWLVIYLKNPSILVREYCKFALIMGLPMVIHDLSRNLLTQSDRVMMQYMGTTEAQIGIYSFFYSYTNIVMTILTALNTSWCPFYYDDLHAGRFCAVKKKSKNYISLFTAITCGFILLSREVAYIFASEEYWSGMPIIPILVSATYFTFMYQFAVNFEFFNKKNTIVGVATCIAAVLNIVLNWILIPRYGMYGAALATALSYAGLVAVHYIAANRIKVMKFHAKLRDFVPGVIAVGVSSVLFYVLADCWVIRWVIGAAIGVMALIDIVKRKSIF